MLDSNMRRILLVDVVGSRVWQGWQGFTLMFWVRFRFREGLGIIDRSDLQHNGVSGMSSHDVYSVFFLSCERPGWHLTSSFHQRQFVDHQRGTSDVFNGYGVLASGVWSNLRWIWVRRPNGENLVRGQRGTSFSSAGLGGPENKLAQRPTGRSGERWSLRLSETCSGAARLFLREWMYSRCRWKSTFWCCSNSFEWAPVSRGARCRIICSLAQDRCWIGTVRGKSVRRI